MIFVNYMKHRKFIERGSREEFYDHISGFIEYPIIFLPELAKIFQDEKETPDELKRLVGLLKLDNYALNIAIVYGIHPITGAKWNKKADIVRLKYLTKRNNDMIKYIESVIKVLEYKVENEFKSKYEDPDDKLFVG